MGDKPASCRPQALTAVSPIRARKHLLSATIDRVDPGKRGGARGRVLVEQYEVGCLARRDGPRFVVNAKESSGVERCDRE